MPVAGWPHRPCHHGQPLLIQHQGQSTKLGDSSSALPRMVSVAKPPNWAKAISALPGMGEGYRRPPQTRPNHQTGRGQSMPSPGWARGPNHQTGRMQPVRSPGWRPPPPTRTHLPVGGIRRIARAFVAGFSACPEGGRCRSRAAPHRTYLPRRQPTNRAGARRALPGRGEG